MLTCQEPVCVDTDEGLNPADTGTNRRLTKKLDQTESVRAVNVRTTAQLAGPVTNRNNPHLLAVFLTEHRDRAQLTSLRNTHDLGSHGKILGQDFVDLLLNVGQHRFGNGPWRAEIEPEPTGRVLRPRLRGGVDWYSFGLTVALRGEG